MIRHTVVAGLVLLSGVLPASARTSLHDIPWYQAHARAREATIGLCRSDHRFSHDVDCLNAETAADRAYAQRLGASAFASLAQQSTVSYWLRARVLRAGALARCRFRPSIYTPAECAAARQAEAMDPYQGGTAP